ncbi:AMP-binding protein [Actinomadura rugatobispora]|uniref:AMP-binding protein n=1 Tax=Actinomadura rugatobispora TaxID=1994 RepID=A0ABW0ZPU5_9ACTN|nr:ATP-dependent acyl-CoA ligase [Actinomadura rugatobispora]
MTAAWQPDDAVSLPVVLDRRAEMSGDRVAVTINGVDISYADMATRSIRYANGLLRLGVGRGEPVSMLMANSTDHVLGWLGASRLGAVDIPINTAYTGDFLRRTLQNANSRVLLCDDEYLDTVRDTARDGGVEIVVLRGGDSSGLARLRAAGLDAVPWEHLEEGEASRLNLPGEISYRDMSSVIYTSGTTGASKGVTFSHNYLLSAARQMLGLYQSTEDDTYFGSMPMFHLAAKACGVVGSLLTGQHTVLDPKFSVSRTWQRVRETEATVVHLLGSMIVMLYNQPETPEDAELPMRAIFAAPVPGTIQQQFEERFDCKIVTCYALSEACQITKGGLDVPYPPNSAGRVNDELFEVRLVEDGDVDVPLDTTGEIVVRPKKSQVMFSGYWRNPAATQEAMDNLWFHTGDLGRIDEDGWFYYEGRKKDALRRRGENVSAAELEDVLRQHPAVNDAAAVGVPSEVMEDDIFAVVELVEDATVDYAELQEFCAQKLPFFMVPRYYEIVASLPRNPIAKVEKYRIKSQGLTTSTWDATAKDFVEAKPV